MLPRVRSIRLVLPIASVLAVIGRTHPSFVLSLFCGSLFNRLSATSALLFSRSAGRLPSPWHRLYLAPSPSPGLAAGLLGLPAREGRPGGSDCRPDGSAPGLWQCLWSASWSAATRELEGGGGEMALYLRGVNGWI